jgi:hypothetical protein
MPTLHGRNYQLAELQLQWGTLYTALDSILGNTFTQMPFGDPHFGLPSASTFTGRRKHSTGLAPTWTWEDEPPDAFDTPLDLTDSASYQGIIPVLSLNNSNESISTADATYWSRVSAAFSICLWLNVTDATSSELLAKFAVTGDAREWRFILNSSDKLQMFLYDESVSGNPTIDTEADVALSENIWVFVGVTVDGSADASGINLYQDGALVASSDTDDAAFVAMENHVMSVLCGRAGNTPNYIAGKVAGGPCGPIFEQAVWTAEQIKNMYELQRRALGV